MLARVVRIISDVVSPVVVVAAPGQELPELPAGTLVTRDEILDQGPLGGLAAGMAALRGRADAVYTSSCDVPLLKAEFVRVMLDALGTHELAIPRDGQFHHPLAAVYRTSLEVRVGRLIAEGRLRSLFLVQESDACLVDVSELRAVDPALNSLRNTNTPEEFREALLAAGLPARSYEERVQ
jgi:molybdopterin-guanine dinucleotide biosynthesis protein A